MRIVFDHAANTYVAYDNHGSVLSVYRPKRHGTLEEWKNATRWEHLDREV